MTRSRRYLCMLAALNLLVLALACTEAPTTKAEGPSAAPEIVAVVAGTPITMQEVDQKFLANDMKLAQQLYDARRQALDQIIVERLLAKEAAAQNLTIDQLIQQEVTKSVPEVSDADVEKFYNQNKGRMGSRTLEQMSPQIRQYLQNQSRADATGTFYQQLKEKAGVKISLEPPRITVAVAMTDPRLGPPEAKITIVEFSDFQ